MPVSPVADPAFDPMLSSVAVTGTVGQGPERADGPVTSRESSAPWPVPVRTTRVSVPAPARGDALGFSVEASLTEGWPDTATPADGPEAIGPYGVAEVRVWVNGRDLSPQRSLFFDAVQVLVRRDTPGAFDLYTCSCGEAGCVGIFRCLRQTLAATTDGERLVHVPQDPSDSSLLDQADTVVWRLPLGEPDEGGFLGRLGEGWTVVEGAYELRFDRAHFEAALDALHAHLETLTALFRDTFAAPMTVLPDYDPAWVLLAEEPLLDRLPVLREQFEEREAWQVEQRTAYGPLLHTCLLATLPNGRAYSVYPSRLAHQLAEVALGQDADPEAINGLILTGIVPAWREDRDRMIPALLTLPWSLMEEAVSVDAWGPEDGEGNTVQVLDDAAMADQWARATHTWRTFAAD